MRRSDWTPSIVPRDDDQNAYLVVDDLGRLGGVWREAEAEVEATDLETVIVDLLDGQYKNPVRIVGFNTAEKWSHDVSTEVAQKLRQRCDLQLRDIPFFLQDFVDRTKAAFATSSCRCRSACSEPWHRSAKSPRRSASRMPLPGFIEPAPATGIAKVQRSIQATNFISP